MLSNFYFAVIANCEERAGSNPEYCFPHGLLRAIALAMTMYQTA